MINESDVEKNSEIRNKGFIHRIGVSFIYGILLNFVVVITLNFFSSLIGQYFTLPKILVAILFLPGVAYCNLMPYELPTDDAALYEAGRAMECFLVGLVLNLLYYTLLIYVGWWFLEKLKLQRLR